MNCKLFVIAILGMALFASKAIAAGPGWIGPAKVQRVVVVHNGGINFRLSPELSGCTSQSGYGQTYASVYPTHAGLSSILSVLLTAYTSGQQVSVYLSDNTCKVGEVVLGGVH